MPTSIAAHVLRKQMALDGADPFEIAADALLRIAALEAQLKGLTILSSVDAHVAERSQTTQAWGN